MVPELKKLNSDLSARGIVFLSVDVEDDPDTANTFLKRKDAAWQNLHDADNSMRSGFHAGSAVPWQVFIDSDGKVAFYRREEDIDGLRGRSRRSARSTAASPLPMRRSRTELVTPRRVRRYSL